MTHALQYEDFHYFDAHVHLFPEKLFTSIWSYFEHRYWPIYFKDTPENLALRLVDHFNVNHFLVLNYAHKPGIARSMNDWTYSLCSSPRLKGKAIPFGTIHPGDSDMIEEVDRVFGQLGFAGIKLQLMVTDFYFSDERMKPVYDKILAYDKVLLVHVGTGPTYTNYFPGPRFQHRYTGVKYLKDFMEEYPEIKIVIPHMGAEEYEEMWPLARSYPNLYFDSAMICAKGNTAFDDDMDSVSDSKLYEISDRILFGSDYPNIPYDYRNSVLGWLERKMDGSFYEKIFFENAQRLFRVHP